MDDDKGVLLWRAFHHLHHLLRRRDHMPKVAMQNLFTEEEHKLVQVFYCPGGINYEKMTPATYLIMKVFAKMMQSKKGQEEAGAMLSSSYDISDKKYIAPIIACLEEAAG